MSVIYEVVTEVDVLLAIKKTAAEMVSVTALFVFSVM